MGINLTDRVGSGLSPQTFIENMSVNKESFLDWYERFNWEDTHDKAFFTSFQDRDDIHCFILAADWCGDVVRNVPAVFRVLEEAQIKTEILVLEENYDVMDQFLTFGARAIPKVIFTSKSGTVLGEWGPRPKHVQEVMAQFKKENPDRNASDYKEKIKEVYADMAKQYGEGTDYQQVIVTELRQLLASF